MLSGDSTQFGAVRIGLRPKFIGAFATVTIVMAIIIVSFVQWRVRRVIDDQTLAQGQAIADTVKATAGYYVMFGLTDDLKKIIVDLRHRSIDRQFLSQGGTQNDAAVRADFLMQSGIRLSGTLQYESWRVPLLATGPQRNLTTAFELGYWPRGHAR